MKKYKDNCGLKQVFPIFFWQRCKKCKNPFRREYGWELHRPGNFITKEYVCAYCCPTPEDANQVFYPPKPLKQRVALTYCPDCLGRLSQGAGKCETLGCDFTMPKGKVAEPNDYGHLY
jgi:hypothetical protein